MKRTFDWLQRLKPRPVFNLNDPRWGRDGEDAPKEPKNQPELPPTGRKPQAGPPDLDELWRDFNNKLGGLFGQRGPRGNGPTPPTGGGNPLGGGQMPRFGFGLIAGVAALIWLGSGIFIVQEGEQAVITQFGRYQSTVGAGINWRMPYPIQRHETVRVTQIRSVDVGRDNVIKATGLRESAMLTEDENIVEIKFAVQYRLKDARAFLFESKNPGEAVVQAAETAVREVVGKMKMDAALAEERDQIAPRVRDLMQKILDRYQVGIEVVGVNLQQGGVRPPEQVQAAFDDVLKAGQERERAKNDAQAYANDVIPRAVGTASRLKQEADGYKARMVAQAEGDAQRFKSILPEYQKAPQVTRERLYLETMEQIYGNINKVIVDTKQGSMLYLPLDKIMQQSGAVQHGTATTTTTDATSANNAAAAQSAGASVPPPSSSLPNTTTDARTRDTARTRERDIR